MHTTAQLWAPITKSTKNDDGTIWVEGVITDAGLDRDGQRCKQEWLDRAIPQWFAEGGNVREQHGRVASGVAVQHERKADGSHWIKALVVDPVSVSKVEHGVLKGWSIGIKNARVTKGDAQAPGGWIVDGGVIETSLVDRPSNPRGVLALAKADASGEMQVVEEQAYVELADDQRDARHRTAEPERTDDQQAVHDAAADVRARAQEVIDALNGLGVDTATWMKADGNAPADDITTAQEAIAVIGRLIQSEAASLASGELKEAGDIGTLLEAVSALKWFIAREQSETDDSTDVFLADGQQADKAEEEQPEPAPQPEGEPEQTSKTSKSEATDDGVLVVGDLTKADLTNLIAAAVSEVTSEWQDRMTKADEDHEAALNALRSDLAKVKAMPTTGGPVRTRVAADTRKADAYDSASLLAKAEELERRASTEPDRDVADGYRQMASRSRAEAASLR